MSLNPNPANLDQNEAEHLLQYVADVNNFLMEQAFTGDACLAAAELMKKSHYFFSALTRGNEDEPIRSDAE